MTDPLPTAPFDPATTLDATPGQPEPAPAERLGRFVIRSRLGEGAFGEVYRAHDPQLDREVALKVAKPGTLTSAERIQRFLREARAAANLRHPHIVPLFETGQDGDRYYIASALIPGGTLADAMKAPLALDRAVTLVRKLAEALGYAHRQGIVHRDIKPANILLDDHGDPLVADFGLAVRTEADETMTGEGAILGTPAYMSPEQAAGRSGEAGPAADQYALGIVLFELLTGRRPFGGTGHALLAAHISAPPPSPRSLNNKLPRDLETIVLKCLEKDPAKRYASCEDLAEDLRRWQAGEPIKARRIGLLERTWRFVKRNPVVASLTALVVLILLAATAVAWSLAARALAGEKRATDNEQAARDAGRRALRHLYAANANLIEGHWEAHRLAPLRRLLRMQEPAAGEPDNRDWEWAFQQRLLHDELRTLTGHTAAVYAVAYAPDGRQVASGGEDRAVRLWDPATGAPRHTLHGHSRAVQRLAYSPDGRWLASVSGRLDEAGEVRLWDPATGAERAVLSFRRGVHGLAFSRDGRTLFTGGRDSFLRVHDIATGEVLQAVEHVVAPWGAAEVQVLALSADGRYLATACNARWTVAIWDTTTWRQVRLLKQERPAELGEVDPPSIRTFGISGLAFSPDGRTLAVSCTTPTAIALSDLTTGNRLPSLAGHLDSVEGVAFSPDGGWLASVGRDETLRLWDATRREQADVYHGHEGILWCLAIAPDGQRMATGGEDGTVKVWSPGRPLNPRVLPLVTWPADLALSPDGSVLAALQRPRDPPTLWQVATGLEMGFPGEPAGGAEALAFHPDGRLALAGGGTLKLVDRGTGATTRTLTDLPTQPTRIVFDAAGRRVAVAGFRGAVPGPRRHEVCVWDLGGDPAPLARIDLGTDSLAGLAFAADGRLLGALYDRTVRAWDPLDGRETARTPLSGSSLGPVAFRADGGLLAHGGNTEILTVELPGGRPGPVLIGHTSHLALLAFDAGGRRLVSAGRDGKAKLWDVLTGQEVRTLATGGLQIDRAASFSAAGVLALALWGEDRPRRTRSHQIRVWDGRPPTAERRREEEAAGLVAGLFGLPLPRADVLAQLRDDPTLTPAVRDKALELARDVRETAGVRQYGYASWFLTRQPSLGRSWYEVALRQAEAAARLAPGTSQALGTLGAAHYRLGRYEGALADLRGAVNLDRSYPPYQALLALTHHRLGQPGPAAQAAGRMRELLREQRWAEDEDAQRYRAEVDAVLGGQP